MKITAEKKPFDWWGIAKGIINACEQHWNRSDGKSKHDDHFYLHDRCVLIKGSLHVPGERGKEGALGNSFSYPPRNKIWMPINFRVIAFSFSLATAIVNHGWHYFRLITILFLIKIFIFVFLLWLLIMIKY